MNIWAVLAAALASFTFGALWYSPLVFLPAWSREAGISPNQHISNPVGVFGLSFVFTLVSAFAFAWWLGPSPGVGFAVASGLAVGICFVATSIGINYQFANRGLLVWLIDSGFHITRFMIIGAVLGLWP